MVPGHLPTALSPNLGNPMEQGKDPQFPYARTSPHF
jgi:hypothetical protein